MLDYNFNQMKAEGMRMFQTSKTLEGKVNVHIGELFIGTYKLSDFEGEFVSCYGRKVKVEINVQITL